jgi:hypothetical protein
MLRICLVATGLLAAVPALALEEPVAWKDPESGCKYWLTPQGGIAPRYRANGQPDCPEIESSDTLGQTGRDITRELGRGLDALKREVDRLGDRFK